MNKNVVEHEEITLVGGRNLRLMSSEMIQQVISFLNGLTNIGTTLSIPFYQFPGVRPTATTFPRMSEALGTMIFPHIMFVPIMDKTEHVC